MPWWKRRRRRRSPRRDLGSVEVEVVEQGPQQVGLIAHTRRGRYAVVPEKPIEIPPRSAFRLAVAEDGLQLDPDDLGRRPARCVVRHYALDADGRLDEDQEIGASEIRVLLVPLDGQGRN